MVEIQLTFLMKIKVFILTIVQRLIRNNPNCHQNLKTPQCNKVFQCNKTIEFSNCLYFIEKQSFYSNHQRLIRNNPNCHQNLKTPRYFRPCIYRIHKHYMV